MYCFMIDIMRDSDSAEKEARSLRTADIRAAKDDRLAALEQSAAEAMAAGEVPDRAVAEAIRRYEFLYKMTCEELTQRLETGQVSETVDISRWLFLISVREHGRQTQP